MSFNTAGLEKIIKEEFSETKCMDDETYPRYGNSVGVCALPGNVIMKLNDYTNNILVHVIVLLSSLSTIVCCFFFFSFPLQSSHISGEKGTH